MRKNLIFVLGFWAVSCFGSVEVVFLEVKNAKGEVLFLEPGFPYAHMGISWNERVLHSHPQTGVTVVDLAALESVGRVKERIPVELPQAWAEKAKDWIGKPYDSGFSWDDDRFYCSELVAKLLSIPPEPMHFDSGLWPPSFLELEGKPGISPGKIYRKITGQDFSFQ